MNFDRSTRQGKPIEHSPVTMEAVIDVEIDQLFDRGAVFLCFSMSDNTLFAIFRRYFLKSVLGFEIVRLTPSGYFMQCDQLTEKRL